MTTPYHQTNVRLVRHVRTKPGGPIIKHETAFEQYVEPGDWPNSQKAQSILKALSEARADEPAALWHIEFRGTEVSWHDDEQGRWSELQAKLFIGVFPGGISYCDRTIDDKGDFLRVAFLPYRSLELKEYEPAHPLLPLIRKDAQAMQARRGEEFPIDGAGHTVILGGAK